jgi:alpha-galactosidase
MASRKIGVVSATPEEMGELAAWVNAKFRGIEPAAVRTHPCLAVLASQYGGPRMNTHPDGHRLNIAGRKFAHSVYAHAVSRIAVHLPGPAKAFAASVGVDSNPETRPGRANVVFSVTVGGKPAFRTGVLCEGTVAVPVKVGLGGAQSFVIEASDAGQGFGLCQAVWGSASVTLKDGRRLWLDEMAVLDGPPKGAYSAAWPFSFRYDGKRSADLLKRWPVKRSTKRLDDQRTRHTLVWRDPRTHLTVRCVAIAYGDFPVAEWTVYLKNDGSRDTPILEDIQALDARFERDGGSEFVLHHYRGDFCTADGYEPYDTTLEPRSCRSFAPFGGRPTNLAFPYYNLEMPGEGVIVVVGWPGQWASRFERDESNGLHIRAGQELTHLRLRPGEEIRTPLMALLFWKGNDRIRSQNLWRRWMMAHNMPRPGGKLPAPFMPAGSSLWFNEMSQATDKDQIQFIQRYRQEGIKLDYWWMDAGWYFCDRNWPKTGTWEVDTDRFPHGLRAVSDHAHARGINILVWFEPERVHPGTWLYEKRPQWLLGADGGNKLLDLGNPEARQWLVDHVDRTIAEQGIDLYRQDFNFDPLPYWRANDAADRQGITENHHVTGYLAWWDELRHRYPNMLLDTCASGGRRNDLETLRRAVPLHKTDYNYSDLPVKQAFHHTLQSWMPFFGAPVLPVERVDVYAFRSAMCPMTAIGFDVRRKDLDYALLRKLTQQWRRVAPRYYGDYYPLMAFDRTEKAWIGWQFNRPEDGDGLVQFFRRKDAPYTAGRFRLHGLDPDARYRVEDLDADRPVVTTGRRLMEDGLPVRMDDAPQTTVFLYQQVKRGGIT